VEINDRALATLDRQSGLASSERFRHSRILEPAAHAERARLDRKLTALRRDLRTLRMHSAVTVTDEHVGVLCIVNNPSNHFAFEFHCHPQVFDARELCNARAGSVDLNKSVS
jgi:hypothetical protein